MTEQEALHMLAHLDQRGVVPWIDGGWGVDALLGRQTRDHSDLDVVVTEQDEPAVRAILTVEGFAEVEKWFTTPVHTVWEHEDGRDIDLHVIAISPTGDGIYGDEAIYPAQGLTGHGLIGGRKVRCISAEVQVEFHRGYVTRERDRQDMNHLHAELGIDLPPEYAS